MIRVLIFISISVGQCLTQQEPLNIIEANNVLQDVPSEKNDHLYKYSNILSILHNDKSNKKLLDRIEGVIQPVQMSSRNMLLEIEEPWKLTDNIATTEDLVFLRDIESLNNYRKKRSNEAAARSPSLEGNRVKKDAQVNKKTHENIEVPREIGVPEDAGRTRRNSAIRILRDLFASESVSPSTKFKAVVPIHLRQSHEIKINSTFSKILENLTSSVDKLNQNINNLRIGSGDEGHVLIKVPPTTYEDKNPILRNHVNNSRSKREINETEAIETATETHTPENVTNKSISTREINESPSLTNATEYALHNTTKENKGEVYTKRNNDTVLDSYFFQNIHDELKKINASDTRKIDSHIITNSGIDDSFNVTEDISPTVEDQTESNNSAEETTTKSIARTTLDLRQNLIEYIEHTFQEIKKKVQPIKYLKDNFASNSIYKIGYIIATIDSVDITIRKLNKKLEVNRDIWEVKKLQQVLRKLDLSNDLLEEVMHNLDAYVGQ